MWILLVLLIAGTIMMEWPMNPNKKKEKDDGSKGTDGDA